MSGNGEKLIRLKPYNPRAGFVLQSIMVRGGARFDAGKWYKVDSDLARYLEKKRERDGDATSPLAFDICNSEEEAKELVRREEEEKRRGTTPEDAVDMAHALTTKTLPKPVTVTPDAVEEEEPPPRPSKVKAKRKPKIGAKPKAKAKAKPKAKAKRKRK